MACDNSAMVIGDKVIPYIEKELADIKFAKQPLFVDTETIGLYGEIRLVQLYQKSWDEVVLVHYPEPIELAAVLTNMHCVFHNGHYDITTIQIMTSSRWVPKQWDDTLYLSRLFFYKEEKFSLDEVMSYVLDYDPYKAQGLDKKELQKSKWDTDELTLEQKVYAAIDVYHLADVWDVVSAKLDDTSYKLDKHILRYSLDFQNNGMSVDQQKIAAKYEANLKEIASYDLPINVNSYKQVRPYIGSIESDAIGLARLALDGNTEAKEVSIVRKLIRQNSFLVKFDSPTIYGKFQPSARSGRFTCRDQNLQQIPRKLKGMFGIDPNEGRVLVYSDYPQIELRSITCITGEHKMEALFREFKDLHSYTAEVLFGKGYTKEQRQIAKTCNFALLYGAGWNVLEVILIKDADMWLEEHVLRSIISRWKRLWSAINDWQKRGISAWRNNQCWQTPFGRRYAAKMMTDQLNIMNQGFAAEVAKLAMHYMLPKLPKADLANFGHDAFLFECDIEDHEEVATIVSNAMQEAWFEALRAGNGLKIRDLPMPINTFVGYNWGNIEEDYIYEYKLVGMEAYDRL